MSNSASYEEAAPRAHRAGGAGVGLSLVRTPFRATARTEVPPPPEMHSWQGLRGLSVPHPRTLKGGQDREERERQGHGAGGHQSPSQRGLARGKDPQADSCAGSSGIGAVPAATP